MNIKLIHPCDKVLLFLFDSQYEVASTFMRPQEYYESHLPGIRNNFFTVEQFMDAYSKHFGAFTYCQDWTGFNIPGTHLTKFFKLYSHDLLKKEMVLKELIEKNKPKGKFYVIASVAGKQAVMKHEIAHALFHVNSTYKAHMEDLVLTIPKKKMKTLARELHKKGYAKPVIIDEIQAYLSTSSDSELTSMFGDDVPQTVVPKFREFFTTTFKQQKIKLR